MIVWRLKKGADRRVRQGHPWVFASELAHSAREITPGEAIELRDASDHFLGYGYGHPSSQICFRKLASRRTETDVLSVEFFRRRLADARSLRTAAGWTAFSHRWLFAEADGVPGLIVDAFLVGDDEWMVVVQASTAGMDRALPQVYEALASFGDFTIIEAPSSRSRALEGLSVGEKRLVRGRERALEDVAIRLADGLELHCDLLRGQKTGFFLDQQWNASLLRHVLRGRRGEALRVLDICCYVGQWGAHAAAALGPQAHVTMFDTSPAALAFAARNVRADVQTVEGDALKDLGALPAGEFDVVICDPPAFVKKKADLDAGLRAYTKLNRDAFKLVKPGGVFVASSCSGLVRAADYAQVLREASQKAGRTFKQILPGGHGPDHPVRPEFPEGEYLKCTVGRADAPF